MNKDVKAWACSCLNCQRNKVQRYNNSPPGAFPSPEARFSHVHLNVVGPLPPSNGFTHLLTCVDRYTCWAEAIPLPNAQDETIVKAFVSRWVVMFGAPSTVTTDRGAQFESAFFQTLLNFLGCTRIRTTAYHPAANGMVERFHRQLKTALRAVEDPGSWSDNLPLALLGIRAALKSDVGCSSAELVFGTTLRLPGEMITPTSRGADETPDNLVPVANEAKSVATKTWTSLKRPQIKPVNKEDLDLDRSTWRRTVKTGGAIYEVYRIGTAKAKREARKSQLGPSHNANDEPPSTCPRCQQTFWAQTGLGGHLRTNCSARTASTVASPSTSPLPSTTSTNSDRPPEPPLPSSSSSSTSSTSSSSTAPTSEVVASAMHINTTDNPDTPTNTNATIADTRG
nr:unnamed protein product [Spirometra erinaceieuropaei]